MNNMVSVPECTLNIKICILNYSKCCPIQQIMQLIQSIILLSKLESIRWSRIKDNRDILGFKYPKIFKRDYLEMVKKLYLVFIVRGRYRIKKNLFFKLCNSTRRLHWNYFCDVQIYPIICIYRYPHIGIGALKIDAKFPIRTKKGK